MIDGGGGSAKEYYGYAPDNKRIYKRRTDGVEEWTFYGARGERLYGAMQMSSGGIWDNTGTRELGLALYFTGGKKSVWFGGRLLWEGTSPVIQDRLGTNRVGGAKYYPYGGEITNTANDAVKFGTYTRDSFSGLDYADQRFFASTYGRFNTADPYRASAGASSPASWNRYSYTRGDPVNRYDPKGLFDTGGCGTTSGPELCDEDDGTGGGGGGGVGGGDGAGGDADRTPPQVPCDIDASIIDRYMASTPIYGDPTLAKPLAGMGQAFINAALATNTNPAVLVAIGFQESHWGYDQRNSGSNNAFGLMQGGKLLKYETWSNGISAAARSVDSAYIRGNRSVSDLYAGVPGAYCTSGKSCTDAIKSMEGRVRALGQDPNYLGFDCEMQNEMLVKKQ